jgi:hypothetical protein
VHEAAGAPGADCCASRFHRRNRTGR